MRYVDRLEHMLTASDEAASVETSLLAGRS